MHLLLFAQRARSGNKVIDGGEMGLFMALYSALCINLPRQ
jgi:hypothetical protein